MAVLDGKKLSEYNLLSYSDIIANAADIDIASIKVSGLGYVNVRMNLATLISVITAGASAFQDYTMPSDGNTITVPSGKTLRGIMTQTGQGYGSAAFSQVGATATMTNGDSFYSGQILTLLLS